MLKKATSLRLFGLLVACLNETNQLNQTDQMDKTDQAISVAAAPLTPRQPELSAVSYREIGARLEADSEQE